MRSASGDTTCQQGHPAMPAIVVLDTNILLQDPTLRGAHLEKLFIGCRRCGIDVYVPDIVVDELRGTFSSSCSVIFESWKDRLEHYVALA